TFPTLLIDGVSSGEWVNVRRTDNHVNHSPVTDVTNASIRCFNTQTQSTASTATVRAGSKIGLQANQPIYHESVTNVYMAKAPRNVTTWDGSGQVWFKASHSDACPPLVHEITANTNGGTQLTFPSMNSNKVEFTLPKNLPNGEYLVRVENIAIHGAASFGGAQFYLSCAQINVVGGGNGKPGPLVSIPGVYNGREPGILVNIWWPIPAVYPMPGPVCATA
ncbi:glycoside hydrolase family 61 protein, partial [Coprinopsis marcescibilis]